MSKERLILSDCDGVLLLWNREFCKFMTELGHTLVRPDKYNIHERYSVDSKLGSRLIREFNNSERISSLSPFRDSVEHVRKLASHGFSFVIITSLSDSADAKTLRTQNLQNVFGDVFSDIICLGVGSDKSTVLSNWKDSGLFWLEDHAGHAKDGHKLGLNSILIEHEYNAHHKGKIKFPIVSNTSPWSEIYKLICKDYGINEC